MLELNQTGKDGKVTEIKKKKYIQKSSILTIKFKIDLNIN